MGQRRQELDTAVVVSADRAPASPAEAVLDRYRSKRGSWCFLWAEDRTGCGNGRKGRSKWAGKC